MVDRNYGKEGYITVKLTGRKSASFQVNLTKLDQPVTSDM